MKHNMVRCVHITILVLIAVLTILVFPYNSISNDQQVNNIKEGLDTKNTKLTIAEKDVIDIQKEGKPISKDMPIYKPPNRGAPKALVGAGSRGTGTDSTLSLIAPDHVGLTVQKQPSLYWFLSGPTKDRIEFTLRDNQAIQPLLEIDLGNQIEPGLHNISLIDHGVDLSPGKQYWWFVALVPDPEHRSKDVVAGASIEYIEPSEALIKKLTNSGASNTTHVYAESGIWYDAVSSISNQINNSPDDITLRKQRASLMEQVGLQEIAEYELKSGITTD